MSTTSPLSLDGLMPATAPAASGAVRTGGKDFAAMLAEPSARDVKNDEVREAADQLVATAFILPMLEQARNDPFKSDLFHGGKGEEVFGQQLDVIFADNITKSAKFGISEALVKRFQSPGSASLGAEVNVRG